MKNWQILSPEEYKQLTEKQQSLLRLMQDQSELNRPDSEQIILSINRLRRQIFETIVCYMTDQQLQEIVNEIRMWLKDEHLPDNMKKALQEDYDYFADMFCERMVK